MFGWLTRKGNKSQIKRTTGDADTVPEMRPRAVPHVGVSNTPAKTVNVDSVTRGFAGLSSRMSPVRRVTSVTSAGSGGSRSGVGAQSALGTSSNPKGLRRKISVI